MWTRFMDMSSGGGRKIGTFDKILIELPEDQARQFFAQVFGRDPDHVTCDCCGEDYSVSEDETLAEITAYDRNDYEGAVELRRKYPDRDYWKLIPLEDYIQRSTVLVVYADGSTNHPELAG